MAWTKAKTALVAGAVALLVTGTAAIVVVETTSHPFSTNPLTVQVPLNPREVAPDVQPGPHAGGPDHPVSRPDPNARFANLTPKQRVEQTRRHVPESVDDLKK